MILTLLTLFGCTDEIVYNGLFDGPSTADIMMPEESDIFDEAVAFVSNIRSGMVTPIDLKYETALSDSLAAPFLRPRGVATGANRTLKDVVAIATSPETIDVFAIDLRYSQLLKIPYITGKDNGLTTIKPTASVPSINSDASIMDLTAHSGKATTESWLLLHNGTDWSVVGSRSGTQHNRAISGEMYQSDQQEIEFTIEGDGNEGDTIEFTVDTGLIETNLPGRPTFMTQSPIDQRLVIGIAGETNSLIRFYDPIIGDVEDIDMPSESQPWAIEWDDNGNLLVADAKTARLLVYDRTNSNWIEEAAPVRIQSMARVKTDNYDRLYVASADDSRVEAFDISTEEWLDLNLEDPNSTGIHFSTPVIGLSATRTEIALQTESLWGSKDVDNVVIVSLFGGEIHMIEGASGCLATSVDGPGIVDSSLIGESAVRFVDTGPSSNPSMFTSPDTGAQVVANRCGGRLKSEEWTVRYDALIDAWHVEGSISGPQQMLATMNARYQTDRGELSFTLIDGPLPPSDGDTFYFQTVSNVLTISELLNNQSVEPLELPGQPVAFDYQAGPSEGGWDIDRTRAFALLPITNSDIVLRLRLETWTVEVVWN